MFFKHRIMRKLQFDEPVTIEEICEWFPHADEHAIFNAIDSLGNLGFIKATEDLSAISLRKYSSLSEFLTYQSRQFFDYAVGISAIVVALSQVL